MFGGGSVGFNKSPKDEVPLPETVFFNKWRLLYLFISWDHFSTSNDKASRVFEIIKA